MPVKIRITLLFTLLVVSILTIVCGSVYYFSYINRLSDIRTRLTNRAITTGRLLSQGGIFDQALIRSKTKPFHRLGFVSLDPPASLIQNPNLILRVR